MVLWHFNYIPTGIHVEVSNSEKNFFFIVTPQKSRSPLCKMHIFFSPPKKPFIFPYTEKIKIEEKEHKLIWAINMGIRKIRIKEWDVKSSCLFKSWLKPDLNSVLAVLVDLLLKVLYLKFLHELVPVQQYLNLSWLSSAID